MDTVQLSPRILSQVFGTEFTRGSVSAGAAQDGLKPSKAPKISPPDNSHMVKSKENPPNIDNLVEQMLQKLKQVSEAGQEYVVESVEGRLGPKIVKYDVAAYIGSFIISNDRLGVSSQCNFGSVRANTCVFKGKWQYELQLGSKGVMQLGWSTVTTKFSQEKGVGDTIDSYAYDGNRLRKWNQSTAPYGETWQNGDIIGCCIDLDQGHIEFYRNGKSLGIAFSNILRGSGIAYFPAASLAFNENIVANFGATPMQYAVPGYSPMQLQRSIENAKTDLLLQWLDKVLRLFPNDIFVPDIGTGGNGVISSDDYNTLMVVCNRIFEFLGPNMHSAFVVERAFLPFFAKTLGLPEKIGQKQDISNVVVHTQRAYLLLDVMWTFLEEPEMKSYLERLCVILLSYFRSNSLSIKYPFQHYSLHCLIALCGHRRTRRHFLHHLLFDKTNRLMHFLHIRPVDEEVLKELIPEGWYTEKEPENSDAGRAYNNAIQLMSHHIALLENLQIQFLKTLMTNSDGTEKRPSSRSVFLRKMRLFIRDTIRPGSVLQQSVNKAMCTFFRFLKTIAVLYSEELEENSELRLPEIPPAMFYDTTVNYYDIERVGGLSSYLYKSNHVEISQALHIDDYILNGANNQQPRTAGDNPLGVDTPVPGFRTILHVSGQNPMNSVSVPLIRVSLPDNRQGGTLVAAQLGTTQAGHRPPATAHNQTPVIPISVPALARETAETGTETQTPSEGLSSTNLGMLAGTGTGRRLLGRSVSATSSGEELERPLHTAGAALIAGLMGFGGFEHRQHVYPTNPATSLLGRDSGVMDPSTSLRELLDDSIIVFCCGVLKHVEKVVTLQKLIAEYTKAQKTAKENLNSTNFSAAEKNEIQTSIEIFSRKLDEQSRHLAWVKAAVFTPERQQLGFNLLKTILKSLKTASSHGKLFAFVPELYISALVNLTWLLLTQMNPVIPCTNLPEVEDALADVAEFVATHFADTRIVIAETKDTMTQALSMFICNRTMLTALERMPSESQAIMVRAILRPYENRAWAQSNWMLVRMWQGNGFGFQYANSTQSRRSYRAKPVQDEFGISPNLAPTPSPILQSHVTTALMSNQKMAVTYIHSVLNQLNWAFSEFVGLLQEIQNAASRPERVFIESRQLKICCTCFELTQALLRVVEMIFNIASPVLNDFTRDSAQSLLGRLCMLLSQILNRIGSNSGSFAQVIDLDIAGLENVTHYPILSAVAGILLAAVRNELDMNSSADIPVTKALLNEPSFQVKSLDFLFGRNQSPTAEGTLPFSLRDYVPEDISEEDMGMLERVIAHVKDWNQRLQSDADSINDEEVCTICYAYPKTCTFKPCNHRSCRTCIVHHLMNRGECFFCKAVIQQVFTDDGEKIHDIIQDSDTPSETTLAQEEDIL
ncbi:unnamed protein product [Allacma fusca]|uniref:E3 ubiquitin-protein ligase RNF123 n=1 Tax=Allacma fusca TaxID=39272 RepID=A0A8J2KGY1_9HEXA|nr:unnamed protein product [Allacma fusca]